MKLFAQLNVMSKSKNCVILIVYGVSRKDDFKYSNRIYLWHKLQCLFIFYNHLLCHHIFQFRAFVIYFSRSRNTIVCLISDLHLFNVIYTSILLLIFVFTIDCVCTIQGYFKFIYYCISNEIFNQNVLYQFEKY